MKLPKYYCPHCEQFKKWYQVKMDSNFILYCKHCKRKHIIKTKDLLETFIKSKVYNE